MAHVLDTHRPGIDTLVELQAVEGGRRDCKDI